MIQEGNPYRVALYLPSLRGGGTERAMVTLANGFSSRGLQVDLVLAKAEGPYLADVSPSVRVVDIGVTRILASLPGLVRYLRRAQPNALLSAMGHANVVSIVARMLSRVSTRLVVSERSHFSTVHANATSIPGRSMVHLMRWAYPRADAIVAVSRGVAADLVATIGVPRDLVQVISNPVVTETLRANSLQVLGDSWCTRRTAPVLLGVGRLTEAKDFASLIRAFAQLRAKRDLRLMILGEGELRSELEALVRDLGVEEDVGLPGFVANPHVYMRYAAIFVLSSSFEGLPNALIEAMACGTPVVATDCPSGPAEILEDGRWGRLVPVGNVNALAEAIAATLDDRAHPDVATRAADYGIEDSVTKYLKALLSEGAFDQCVLARAKKDEVSVALERPG